MNSDADCSERNIFQVFPIRPSELGPNKGHIGVVDKWEDFVHVSDVNSDSRWRKETWEKKGCQDFVIGAAWMRGGGVVHGSSFSSRSENEFHYRIV